MYPARWIIQLDDSSGATIEVVCGRRAPAPPIGGTKSELPLPAEVRAAVSSSAPLPIGLTATGRTVDLSGIDIGAVVKVKGGVGVFRREKQVLLERVCTIPCSYLPPHCFWLPLGIFILLPIAYLMIRYLRISIDLISRTTNHSPRT